MQLRQPHKAEARNGNTEQNTSNLIGSARQKEGADQSGGELLGDRANREDRLWRHRELLLQDSQLGRLATAGGCDN